MQPEASKLLFDALEAGQHATTFVEGKSEADYLADIMLRSAVERQLFIVGEALSQLRQLDPEVCEQVPGWRSIIGFRNLLAHGYAVVDNRRVWEIIEQELPNTLISLRELVAG